MDWLLTLLLLSPPLLGFWWCCCCSMCATDNPQCKDTITEATITIAGWSDGLVCSQCDETYNGVFIFPIGDSASACAAGTTTTPSTCLGSPYHDRITLSITRSGSSIQLKVEQTIGEDSGSPVWACWLVGLGSPGATGCVTCAGTYSLTMIPSGGVAGCSFVTTSGGLICNYNSANITVVLS